MTTAEQSAQRFLEYVAVASEQCQPCKHGHLDCAATVGGRCCDEYFSELSPAARAIAEPVYLPVEQWGIPE